MNFWFLVVSVVLVSTCRSSLNSFSFSWLGLDLLTSERDWRWRRRSGRGRGLSSSVWRQSWCLRSLCEVRESRNICCSSSQPGSDCPHWSSSTSPAAASPWCWPCSPCWPSPGTRGRRGQCEAPCISSHRTSLTLSAVTTGLPSQPAARRGQARPGVTVTPDTNHH